MTDCPETVASIEAHQALFYRDKDEYLDGIARFVRPALEHGGAIAIAVPTPKLKSLRDHLGAFTSDIEMLDMVELGRNPARIIPAVQAMIDRHGSRPLHYVGEPIWAGRSEEEIREATRHEALINLAWPDADIRVLCPYDVTSLDDAVLEDAERTHPGLVNDGRLECSHAYGGPAVPPGCEQPLPEPPAGALTLSYGLHDLGRVRETVADQASSAGLRKNRAAELVTAVNELTSNTVKHAQSRGLLRLWRAGDEFICQVEDYGHISDPLAGRRRQVTGAGGLGLWIVNQLCDLVEVRTSTAGTVVRAHTSVSPPSSAHGDDVDTRLVA